MENKTSGSATSESKTGFTTRTVVTPNEAMPRVWRRETKPHRFCPGCGHPIILKALAQAVEELDIQGRTVFGCDIGCSLLAWDFFNLDSIQTHHGRTTPVIAGLKRARPDLIGVAYMGDGGGYAIGSQHLLNAAMRNDRITVILCNNTVYAMTGGQMAPTTLPTQKTETTPYGRDPAMSGEPTLGPELIAAIGRKGAYAARGTVANYRQLVKFTKKALENQMADRGFSFLEVLSSCPTNWRTTPRQTWDFVEDDMTRVYKVGEFLKPEDEK